jgi:hypothetical protein
MEWNFVWRWRHWRWPWIHTIPSSSFIHLKMRTSKHLRWEQLLNRLVDLGEILYGGDGIEDDLDSILLNPVASTVPKRRTFKLLRCYKFWTDWWILMEFCIEVMALKMMSITSNWQTFKLLRRANLLNGLVHLDEILCGGDDIQITSMPYFLIPYLQAFQNDRRLNFWGGCKNSLMFELVGGFGWNFTWRWWHWRWHGSLQMANI